MTQISPRVQHDVTTHYARMNRQARHQRRLALARDLTILGAGLLTAALAGWALGAAHATLCALPDIIAQSQTLAAW